MHRVRTLEGTGGRAGPKPGFGRRLSSWVGTALLLASTPSAAIDLADGKLSINGFGQWAFSNVTHNNDYDLLPPGSDFGGGSIALTLHASLLERGHIGMQVRFDHETGLTTLDWGFAEWRFSDLVRLRMGLIQHPFGISGDLRDVGTSRTFYLLPSSVYGTADITGEAVEGASLSGSTETEGGWSLQYDAYFGELQVLQSSPFAALKAGFKPGERVGTILDSEPYLAGGRLILSAPIEGLSFRVSAYSTLSNANDMVIGPSVRYAAGPFDLRAEYFFHYESENPSRTQAAYLEGGWLFTDHFQLGLRGELSHGQLLGYTGSQALLEHRELAGTLNYWFLPNLVVKASMHLIDGNRFADPTDVGDAVIAGTLQRKTIATVIGTQFSF